MCLFEKIERMAVSKFVVLERAKCPRMTGSYDHASEKTSKIKSWDATRLLKDKRMKSWDATRPMKGGRSVLPLTSQRDVAGLHRRGGGLGGRTDGRWSKGRLSPTASRLESLTFPSFPPNQKKKVRPLLPPLLEGVYLPKENV